ncbi:Cac2p KNAG_0G03310 [Huiozyma naganishii CBS 8797]|uniref:CAF1B/HIR1 beta-propeller domain-containing protein n=1 Tax=Huiozyma naganishii (strain ATCC MYA-139 / BCRC 22969 / CBS 8797 / KCTC 17520 / NBRC 10181 / NCYC 3082 / Yp74L-3) TaxID=1071383 RepID=J7S874_HUIN7|nr:hypothetical protein KNAG_0G03310 [Kazachstania naganishii CBS 8797]CCK71389.1 hypothetical protein KNAG_0G03310 [Kazachstania naganishii CBS 8797]
MEASNLQIYWHESQPVYSVCFQPSRAGLRPSGQKLFTAGGDNKVRVWSLNVQKKDHSDNDPRGEVNAIEFISSLQQHEQAVNVLRFNHKGDKLASAGDDGQIIIWEQESPDGARSFQTPLMTRDSDSEVQDGSDPQEKWVICRRLRHSSNSEIYDLCWSPCDQYIVVGCMDNCVRVFNVATEQCILHSKEHNHYVQGVTWDPRNEFILSQSTDRSVNVYKLEFSTSGDELTEMKLANKIVKCELPARSSVDRLTMDFTKSRSGYLFHNETLPSFFRRLTVSPCGTLFCIPAGIFKTQEAAESANNLECHNSVYIYSRAAIKSNSNKPVAVLSFLKKPAIAISFNSNLYTLEGGTNPYIDLPYKLIFAVATTNEVLVYDTVSLKPLAVVGNLHYTPLTDLSWSEDGSLLMISSTDGFCSYIAMGTSLFGSKLTNRTEVLKELYADHLGNDRLTVPSATETVGTPRDDKNSIINILPVKKKIKHNATE